LDANKTKKRKENNVNVNIDYCSEGRSITEPLCAITERGAPANQDNRPLATLTCGRRREGGKKRAV